MDVSLVHRGLDLSQIRHFTNQQFASDVAELVRTLCDQCTDIF